MKLFAKLMKVDVEKRQVWGRATQEVPDKSGEIFDYETSVPHFKDWSAGFEKATAILGDEGKSLGNIRAMHGKVAAGKVISIEFNDVEKAIDIGTEITDDAEWNKVIKGTYTGFSIGGSYAKQWKDDTTPSLTRFTAKPAEISIVDNPCVPTATFSMVKADGAVEEVPFQHAAQADGDPVVDTRAAAETAPTTAEGAEGDDLARAAAAPVTKSLYSIGTLADALATIRYLAMDAESEKQWEGDDSAVPESLRTWLKDGVSILVAMTAEESSELLASVSPLAMAAGADDLTKAGARHSKSDLEKLQGIHDHAAAMGAACDTAKAAGSEDLAKRADEALAKLTELTSERDTLQKRVKELEAQPTPAKGALKVVEKAADIGAAPTNTVELDPASPTFARDVMKAVHAAGGIPITAR